MVEKLSFTMHKKMDFCRNGTDCKSAPAGDWNTSLGYKENTISSAWRYVEVYKPDCDNLYILNPFVSRHGFVKVNYRAHTHPSSGPPSLKDLNHSFYLGYYGKVFGWNGVIYSYRGHAYIQFIYE